MTARAAENVASPAKYRLPLARSPAPVTQPLFRTDVDRVLLRRNLVWFCRLRWVVVGTMIAAALASTLPGLLGALGIQLSPQWLLVTAAVLGSLNAVYLVAIPDEHAMLSQVRVHLWAQIVADLAILTVVIHFLGSIETPAPFMYLFHIILACVFFPPRQSAVVAAVAVLLYGCCLAIESSGIVPPATVLVDSPLPRAHFLASPHIWGVHLVPLLAILGVIWYLASRLAGALRQREAELAITNVRLKASSEERSRYMLQTTHQLKAPFAAIHANAQLLLNGMCGVLPEKACEVVHRIAARCEMLSSQIVEMLQLSNLNSVSQETPQPALLDLGEVVRTCVARVEPTAKLRGISISTQIDSVPVSIAEDHLRMLLDNLLTNAVNYSYDGGQIEVACAGRTDQTAELVIRDHGIGIPADKLPHIFEEFYRTREAVQHNKASTGLGLSIVRDVARIARIQIQVESGVPGGTSFRLTIPTAKQKQGV